MTEGVGERLAEGNRRVERIINPLEQAGGDPAGNG
jgi:hypothetical protein